MNKKKIGIIFAIVCLVFMIPVMCMENVTVVCAANKKIELNVKEKSLEIGDSITLRLRNASSSKIKWYSSNKDIVSVSSKGKVIAKQYGKATITAKYMKKIYKCIITVNKMDEKTDVKYKSYLDAYDALYDYVVEEGDHYISKSDNKMSEFITEFSHKEKPVVSLIADTEDASKILMKYDFYFDGNEDALTSISITIPREETNEIDIDMYAPVWGYTTVNASEITKYDVGEHNLSYFFVKNEEDKEIYNQLFEYGLLRGLYYCNEALEKLNIGLNLVTIGFLNY